MKISLILINESHEVETIQWPVDNSERYVEQVVHEVLESKGVGPVYRILFGLRSIDQGVWLPPNLKLKNLLVGNTNLKFELRFRFRASCYRLLRELDSKALNLIFAQLRRDFIKTKFNNDKRDFVLLNDAVLGLIATDLVRHSLDKQIVIGDILKRVNPNDFIPKRASKWQSFLLFRVAEYINLQKSLQIGYEKCSNNKDILKQKFIELFLFEVAQDYGTEIYRVERISGNPCQMELRVRYNQSGKDSNCHIETRSGMVPWEEYCDIETIAYGTLRHSVVQIARLNGAPMRFKFQTINHAQSFLSCIDGYYRLMRKWNFNLCREVTSPELTFLRRIRCHGPIGYETSRLKLIKYQKTGTFLIRKCMENSNRYLIDTNMRLTIDVVYDPATKSYRVSDHAVNKRGLSVSVKTGLDEYDSLKNLVQNTHIWIQDEPQPLLHWLQPGVYDDYPALLLSMSKKRLKEFDNNDESGSMTKSRQSLPNLIPTQLVKFLGRELPKTMNGQVAKLACFNRLQNVVIKSIMMDEERLMLSSGNSLAFYYNPLDSTDSRMQALEPHQLWRATWPFIKHQFIVETVGIEAASISMIQEYFPHGSLDKYLMNNVGISSVFKLAIAFQLAQALLYLREKQIIHGKIRCHNIFLKQFNPLQIKLSDPLGLFDALKDQAFIPVEYQTFRGHYRTKQYDHGIDIWAFGTTLWQVYSNGIRPPEGRLANEALKRPQSCPRKIWDLIETCWIIDPNSRTSPETLFRDLNDLFAWEKDAHDYFYIEENPRDDDENDDQSTIVPSPSHSSRSSDANSLSTTITTTSTAPEILQSTSSADTSHGSRTNLLKSLDPTHRRTTIRTKQYYHLVKSSSATSASSAETSNDLSHYRRYKMPWRSIVNFKNRHLSNGIDGEGDVDSNKSTTENYSPLTGSHNGHHRWTKTSGEYALYSNSRISLSDCSTPSGSEVTNFTDLDFQSIIDEVDRCVWHVDSNRLTLGHEIGRGSSGIVIKGELSQVDGTDNQTVAVKCIDTDCLDFNLNKIDDLRREFDLLKNLRHKNIVKTLGYVEESNMMLIVEFMPFGSLLSYIRDSHHDNIHSLPLAKYALDIAQGMEYLESMKIVHRDLALRNILLKNQAEAKICDFGLAQYLGTSNHYKLKTERALPLKWYAPEALTNWTFSHKSDVWSYGIVLWEIYSGGNNPQYSGTYANLAETLKHERLPMPTDCPKEMYDLMLNCWAYQPEDRDTFAQISQKLSTNDLSFCHRDQVANINQ